MNNKRLIVIVLSLLAVAGILLLLAITRWGIGTSPDSISYIGVSRNLLAGKGLVNGYGDEVGLPMTFRAPLYPVLLTAGGVAGLTPLNSARLLNALIFGLNIFLVGLLVYAVVREWNWLVVLGSLLILTSLAMVNLHAFAWTEPLFIFLAFSGFLLLATYLDNQRRLLLVLAAILMGLAIVTRYAGLPLLATGGLALLLFGKTSVSRRLADAVLFSLIGGMPFALWTVRNSLVSGSSAGREIALHLVGTTQVWQSVETVSGWLLLPGSVPGIVRISLIAGLGIALLWVIFSQVRLQQDETRAETAVPGLIKLFLLFIVVYIAFLLVSISLVDANTPLDNRILSPVYIALVVILMYAISIIWQRWSNRRGVVIGLGLVASLFLLRGATQSVAWANSQARLGLGFTSLLWQESEVIAETKSLPDGISIYSNVPEAIYLHTNKPALSLPRTVNVTTGLEVDTYPEQVSEVRTRVAEEQAVVVFFNALRQDAAEMVLEVAADLPATLIVDYQDGWLLLSK